jgi:hypothetical protein
MGFFSRKPKPGGAQARQLEYRRQQDEMYAKMLARLRENKNPPGPGPPDGFQGEHRYGNGDRAQGEFRSGKLNGRGRFYSHKDPNYGWREGMFRDNKLHGRGKM